MHVVPAMLGWIFADVGGDWNESVGTGGGGGEDESLQELVGMGMNLLKTGEMGMNSVPVKLSRWS